VVIGLGRGYSLGAPFTPSTCSLFTPNPPRLGGWEDNYTALPHTTLRNVVCCTRIHFPHPTNTATATATAITGDGGCHDDDVDGGWMMFMMSEGAKWLAT